MKGYDIETNENLPPRQRKDSSGFEKKISEKKKNYFHLASLHQLKTMNDESRAEMGKLFTRQP